jgi:hypothetical protein
LGGVGGLEEGRWTITLLAQNFRQSVTDGAKLCKKDNEQMTIQGIDKTLKVKLKGMLWDVKPEKRSAALNQLLHDPYLAFSDEQLLIKALNSLNWYDLIYLLGVEKLQSLLTESAISKLYPIQRRKFYIDAKELLSKYSLSTSG